MTNEDGIVSGLYFLAADLSSSQAMGNLAPYVSANVGILSLSSASSSLMPTIWRPLPAYFALRSWSFGNDFLHGSQKVPQKSTTTTLPRSPWNETIPRVP